MTHSIRSSLFDQALQMLSLSSARTQGAGLAKAIRNSPSYAGSARQRKSRTTIDFGARSPYEDIDEVHSFVRETARYFREARELEALDQLGQDLAPWLKEGTDIVVDGAGWNGAGYDSYSVRLRSSPVWTAPETQRRQQVYNNASNPNPTPLPPNFSDPKWKGVSIDSDVVERIRLEHLKGRDLPADAGFDREYKEQFRSKYREVILALMTNKPGRNVT